MGASAFGRFDRLAIDNSSAWCRLASRLQAQALPQNAHELFPDAGIA
jgi:hypothetical protein